MRQEMTKLVSFVTDFVASVMPYRTKPLNYRISDGGLLLRTSVVQGLLVSANLILRLAVSERTRLILLAGVAGRAQGVPVLLMGSWPRL